MGIDYLVCFQSPCCYIKLCPLPAYKMKQQWLNKEGLCSLCVLKNVVKVSQDLPFHRQAKQFLLLVPRYQDKLAGNMCVLSSPLLLSTGHLTETSGLPAWGLETTQSGLNYFDQSELNNLNTSFA